MERQRLLNVPNALTGLRVGLILAFVAVHLALPERRGLSATLMALAGATDFLDGWAARALRQVTWLGKLLDPLADKLMIAAALACLLLSGALPAWLAGTLLAKELYMVVGGALLYRRRIVMASDLLGKAATFLFVPAAVLLYAWPGAPTPRALGMGLMVASTLLSCAAAVHYTLVAVKKARAQEMD